MYTGVVEGTAEIASIERATETCRIDVAVDTDGIAPDDSIALSGVCVTAETVDPGRLVATLSAETVERTYLADLEPGDAVNVERPVAVGGRLDGHVVKGTVDTTIDVRAIETDGEGWVFTAALPPAYAPYVVEKGAVALDGVSLTVADVGADTFDVAVIPRTYELTTLAEKQPGDPLHLEVDVLAKYVERQRSVSA